MIDREKAYELTDSLEKSECTEVVRRTLDLIYDSIGSCGECAYFRELDHNDKPRCKYVEIEVHKDFYCADFERKRL